MLHHTEHRYAGIYKFTNKINGKVYVGQAKDIYQRYYKHFNSKVIYGLFGKAKVKYGIDGFNFEVLERVDDLTIIDQREQYWMDFFQCYDNTKGYNVCTIAGSTRGLKNSAEVIERTRQMGKAQVGEKNPFYGRKHSDEYKKMISRMNTGRKATPEQRAKLAEIAKISQPKEKLARMTTLAMEKVIKEIAQIDPNTGHTVRVWKGVNEIAKELPIKKSKLRALCNGFYWTGGRKLDVQGGVYMGFNWQYISNHNGNVPSLTGEPVFNNNDDLQIAQIEPTRHQILKIWDSASQIKRETGLNLSTILNNCKGIYHDARSNAWYNAKETAGGFEWRFISRNGELIPRSTVDIPEMSRAKQAGVKKRKKVEQININTGEIVRVWDSVNDISNELGLNRESIKNTCRGYYGTQKGRFPKTEHAGYRWQYVD